MEGTDLNGPDGSTLPGSLIIWVYPSQTCFYRGTTWISLQERTCHSATRSTAHWQPPIAVSSGSVSALELRPCSSLQSLASDRMVGAPGPGHFCPASVGFLYLAVSAPELYAGLAETLSDLHLGLRLSLAWSCFLPSSFHFSALAVTLALPSPSS